MKKIIIFCLGVALSWIETGANNPYKYQSQGLDVQVQFYSLNIVRVFKTSVGKSTEKESMSVIVNPQETKVEFSKEKEWVTMTSGRIVVKLNEQTGSIEFLNPVGKRLLYDKDYGTQFTAISDAGKPSYAVRQVFLLEPDEIIFGLGQQQSGLFNQRNQRLELRNVNMNICIPFIHSEKGYGLYWDNQSPTCFTDNPQEMSFDSEVGLCADYYFIYGGDAEGVIAGVRTLTGQAPLYPLWTLGFWQSRERYKSPEELCEVVDTYRRLQVPLDGIVQDWQYWGNNENWNAVSFDNPLYVDGKAKQMIDHVHKQNAHIIISVWPSFGRKSEMYHIMDSLNALLPFETYPAEATPYDPFNPMARDVLWKRMKENIFDLGMDGWWLDATEPEHKKPKDSDYDVPTYLGSFRSVHNGYPIMSSKTVYERQREVSDKKRVFILTRSSSLGQQRYASHSWSGDVVGNWDVFRRQIAAGQNYSLCGIPYWNTDLGGFYARDYGNDNQNPAYQEMHVRWYEWGVFQPIMRSHNSGPVPVEIYQFGQKGHWAYDAMEKFTRLRYRLLPYLYSTTWQVTSNQGSIIRPLLMDFADDRQAVLQAEEYMFGKSFLIRPETDSLYTYVDEQNKGHLKDLSRIGTSEVYLPKGARWFDFWTNECLEGGQTIQRKVPIDLMPVYVRAGSIVPWGPEVQYSTEKNWNDLEIRVYPGADADFVLYEDAFDGYGYEHGQYTEIPFHWDEASRTLTIEKRKGNYEGLLRNRTFRVQLVGGESYIVKYTGKRVKVKSFSL